MVIDLKQKREMIHLFHYLSLFKRVFRNYPLKNSALIISLAIDGFSLRRRVE